jgi:hypothetical protein
VLRERFLGVVRDLAGVTVPNGFYVAIIRAVDDAMKAIPSRLVSRVVVAFDCLDFKIKSARLAMFRLHVVAHLKWLDDSHMEVARR